jgi:hypothetical protein
MLPQVPSELASGHTDGVEIRGGGIITEGPTSVNDTIGSLDESVHSHTIRMVAHQSKGSTDIIVGDIDLRVGIGYAEVVKPYHKS